MFFRVYLFCLCIGLVGPLAAAEHPDQRPSIERLRQGGLVIFFRHTQTVHSEQDSPTLDLSRCETQRNLSTEGRKQAQLIGQAFQQMSIPIGEVLSSPFCRCLDTAQIAFGQAKSLPYLYYALGLHRTNREEITTQLRQLMTKPIAMGENRIIISHSANLQEAMGIWPDPEGVAWVFEPHEKGLKTLGKIHPQQWLELH
ncbi:histidine phosphatase family protein [Magnetococcus sp. PR-3]|uniref:histidine phosphatase family protein n=1 Tax=Magnetococcus sp. PR-3 TaxID=3120355 RepID=UPI002FCE3FCB